MADTSPRRGRTFARGIRALTLAVTLVATALRPAPALAQNLGASSIEGTVADQTGARLPGVTVTATSPALQVRQQVAISDGDGRYRFVDLSPGTYTLSFELAGFVGLVRQGLELSAGFVMRVDAALNVGTAETITVSGQAPVVDPTTTRGGQTISTDMIVSVLPGSRTVADLVSLTPGMKNIAGGNPAQFVRPRFNMYGIDSTNTNSTMMLDGFQIITNNPLPDVGATQEVDVRTFGNGAEVKEIGAVMNMVVKSGGDTFHGGISDAFMLNPRGNIDDGVRARGLTVGEEIDYFNDIALELGGPIVRNRLWFFGAWRDRRNTTTVPGLVQDAGPDGIHFSGDEAAAKPERTGYNITGKLSYQIAPRYQVQTIWTKDQITNDAAAAQTVFGVNNARTPWEATSDFNWRPYIRKGEFRGTPTDRSLFNLQFGKSGYINYFGVRPEGEGKPTSYDRATNVLVGSNTPRSGTFLMWILDANLAYAPAWQVAGRHEFKLGYHLSRRDISSQSLIKSAGDYALLFDIVNGRPHQAAEFEANNSPVDPTHWDNVDSVYVADQWRVADRVTLNLGMRWDRQHSFVPAQSREAGQFAPAADFPRVDVLTYSHLAPRAAAAWDITGTGRSVLKASYGWFNTEAALAADFNRNAAFTTRYRWRDLNGNQDYDPGEVNLDPNGTDFISTTNSANSILNPNLRLSNAQEVALSMEQQVGARIAVRGLYLYRRLGDLFNNINVRRPYEAFSVPITRTDPGPDGNLGTADDGGRVTIYDYTAAFRGAAFVGNQNVNRPEGRDDYFQSLEGALSMRFSAKWSMQASYTATKFHRWLTGIAQSPNDDFFPLDTAWRWTAKFAGNYTLPWDITTGVILDASNGLLGQRSFVFRRTDPSGPALQELNTVTVRLEPFGSRREPAQVLVNLRAGKRINIGAAQRVELSVDLLNAANSNAIVDATYVSGPTFGNIREIVPPRQMRVSLRYSF